MKKTLISLFILTCLFFSQNLLADWDVGDLHKMGGAGPQLPDPTGYDVSFNSVLADDWQCGETGPVDSIHIWISWRGLQVTGPEDPIYDQYNITGGHIEIWSDDPVGDDLGIPNQPEPGGEDPNNDYSKPLNLLWETNNETMNIMETERPWSVEEQGWYDPSLDNFLKNNDHNNCEQVNLSILDPNDAFQQQEGETYWLQLSSITIESPDPPDTVGWKTSTNHWNDNAVWHNGTDYLPLPYLDSPTWPDTFLPPYDNQMDFAFVISGSDATLPVELSTFNAVFSNNATHLSWVTQTEKDNLGWNVYRNTDTEFSAASQINNDLISGHGTTSEPSYYNYSDGSEELTIGTTYYYWLESLDLSGQSHVYNSLVSITIPDPANQPPNYEKPVVYNLNAAPNPMLDQTDFHFTLDRNTLVNISIYNLKGKLVKKLPAVAVNADEASTLYWNGKDRNDKKLSSGVYLYKLEANGKTVQTQKLIIMR